VHSLGGEGFQLTVGQTHNSIRQRTQGLVEGLVLCGNVKELSFELEGQQMQWVLAEGRRHLHQSPQCPPQVAHPTSVPRTVGKVAPALPSDSPLWHPPLGLALVCWNFTLGLSVYVLQLFSMGLVQSWERNLLSWRSEQLLALPILGS
jgi:hypothetical protein